MEYVQLKEICSINMGQSPDSKSYNNDGNGMPFYQGNADFGETHPVTRVWCTEPTKIAEKDDILLSVRAPIGALNIADETCCIGRGLAAITPNAKLATTTFIYWCLKCKNDELNSKGTGSTFKAINKKTLEETLIPKVSFAEQQYISETLQRVFSIITHRRQQLQELDELVKARFVEMFPQGKYPRVKAGTFMTDMRNGVSPSTTGTHLEKVLTLSAITQGIFDATMWKEGLFDEIPPIEKRITNSDFYMCRGNGNKALVGSGVYSDKNRADLVFPDTVIAAKVDLNKIYLPYLQTAWSQPGVRQQIESSARTTNGTYKVNQKIIASIEMEIPEIEQQMVFSNFVAQVDKSKVAVQAALDEAQLLFDSLMQKYFG